MKRIAVSLTAIIILFTVILSSGASALALSAEENYDLKNPSTVSYKTVGSDEILEKYLSEELSDNEKSYLAEYGTVTIEYDDSISTGNVVCIYGDGTLTVNAIAYTYFTADEREVSWIPVSVRVGEREVPLSESGAYYSARLDGIAEDESLVAEVNYVLSVRIARDDLSSIVNQAYNDAPEWERRLDCYRAEYERQKEKYDRDLISYREYLLALTKYDSDVALYNSYLASKRIYDDEALEYAEYVRELAEYEECLSEYNEYLSCVDEYNRKYSEYIAYLGALSKYDADMTVYREKLLALDRVRSQLSIIDASRLPITEGRDVYSAIWSGLVDEVLANKSVITSQSVGVSEDVVYAAGDSTENLRALLQNYFSLGTEEEKYTYYTLNYVQLKENFKKLTQALNELYKARAVRNWLRTEDKDRKYMILVSELAYVSEALEGEPIKSYYGDETLDSDYVMKRESESFAEILGNGAELDMGIDPIPDPLGYPSVGEEPVPPTVKTEPRMPETVVKPIPPKEVKDPGEAPTPVEKPMPPETVEEPKEPEKYEADGEVLSLVELYKSGNLKERELPSADFILEIEKTVEKKLFLVDEVSVFFLSEDGRELYNTVVDKGTLATYVGKLPEKAPDDAYTYTFLGWGSEDGEVADLSSVDCDLILYPVFEKHIKSYTVTFISDGGETVLTLPYGSTPEIETVPTKPDNGGIEYVFSGWNKPIAPVSGDAVYEAVFREKYIVPTVGGGAEITYTDGCYTVYIGETPSYTVNLSGVIERALLRHSSVRIDFGDEVIEIPYSSVALMNEMSETTLSVSISDISDIGYAYRFSITDGKSASALGEYKISVVSKHSLPDLSRHVLCEMRGEEKVGRVRYSESNGKLIFTINANTDYVLMPEYKINLISGEGGELRAEHSFAFPGDEIRVFYSMKDGSGFVGINVFGSQGEAVRFSDGFFVMPSFDVSVALISEEITYTIRFMNGNQVLAELRCKYGDIPTPPSTVQKMNDDEYSYSFVGWSSEIVPVDSDMSYYAVFESRELPPKERPSGLQISPLVMKLLVALATFLFMMTCTVIPSFILLVVLLFKDKKRRIRRRKKQ